MAPKMAPRGPKMGSGWALKSLKTLGKIAILGYLGLCWGCWGLFWVSWFQAGALNQCRARAWANRRVPWARPGREPECSFGGEGGAPP